MWFGGSGHHLQFIVLTLKAPAEGNQQDLHIILSDTYPNPSGGLVAGAGFTACLLTSGFLIKLKQELQMRGSTNRPLSRATQQTCTFATLARLFFNHFRRKLLRAFAPCVLAFARLRWERFSTNSFYKGCVALFVAPPRYVCSSPGQGEKVHASNVRAQSRQLKTMLLYELKCGGLGTGAKIRIRPLLAFARVHPPHRIPKPLIQTTN